MKFDPIKFPESETGFPRRHLSRCFKNVTINWASFLVQINEDRGVNFKIDCDPSKIKIAFSLWGWRSYGLADTDSKPVNTPLVVQP